MALIVKCNNGIVTNEYIKLIGNALEDAGQVISYTNNLNDTLKLDKGEIIVVARCVEAFKLVTRGYKNVVVWFQGIEPEESYMAHHSKLRYYTLSFMEKTILRKARFNIFVSKEMEKHYKKKYKSKLSASSVYVMPCQNTELHPEAFQPSYKYQNNIFAYTGSMAVWQKFEDTVTAYKQIEDSGISNCEFWVFTAEKEVAQRILDAHKVGKYKIDFVKSSDLPLALAGAKYGFIIREDTPVNRVATPTKISTYLSCGLIPIYSNCLTDFCGIASSMEYAICYEDEYIDKINEFYINQVDNMEVLKEYQRIFREYYDSELHRKNLSKKFQEIFK